MIKNRLTLKQLEALVCVVDTGSFRKAAAVLGTTQPNISARIAALETQLGVVLMHRDAGSVRVTARGGDLVKAARDVLRSAEAFLERAGRPDLIDERLRLGVTEIVACTWLHRFLRALKARYPAVQVELEVNLGAELTRAMAAGELDLTLQTGDLGGETPGVQPLGQYPYGWVASPDLAADLGPAPDLARLFAGPVLTHARHAQSSAELRKEARRLGLPLDQIAYSSSLASCVPMARDGLGIALLPRKIVTEDIAQGHLIALTGLWEPSALRFFTRHDPERAPRFVEAAAALAAECAKDSP